MLMLIDGCPPSCPIVKCIWREPRVCSSAPHKPVKMPADCSSRENSGARNRGDGRLCWWWAAKMKFGGLENCQITCFKNTNPDNQQWWNQGVIYATPSSKNPNVLLLLSVAYVCIVWSSWNIWSHSFEEANSESSGTCLVPTAALKSRNYEKN